MKDNAGTTCWQGVSGASHCVIHGNNLNPDSSLAKGLETYVVAMAKALQQDGLKQDVANIDNIVNWQVEAGSLNNLFVVKLFRKLFS